MRRIVVPVLVLTGLIFLAGCGPKVSVQTMVTDFTPRDEKCYLVKLGADEQTARAVEQVGVIGVGDTGLTFECGYWDVYNSLKERACALGGELIRITEVKEPNLWTSCYRMKADVYRFAEPWPNSPVDLAAARERIDAMGETLPPIVGVWQIADYWRTGFTTGSHIQDSEPTEYQVAVLPTEDGSFVVINLDEILGLWHTGDLRGRLSMQGDPSDWAGDWYGPGFVKWPVAMHISQLGKFVSTATLVYEDGREEDKVAVRGERVYP